jgi:hypothetical protein
LVTHSRRQPHGQHQALGQQSRNAFDGLSQLRVLSSKSIILPKQIAHPILQDAHVRVLDNRGHLTGLAFVPPQQALCGLA